MDNRFADREYSATMTDLTVDGRGIGHLTAQDVFFTPHGSVPLPEEDIGRTVFVYGALPGDVVRLRVHKRKKNILEAQAVELLTPSTGRRSISSNPYVQNDGTSFFSDKSEDDLLSPHDGFPLLAWNPAEQKAWKMRRVHEALVRVGGFSASDLPEMGWISDEETHYRNKINLRLASDGRLGDTARDGKVRPLSSYVIAAPILEQKLQQWNALALQTPNWAKTFSAVHMVILRANEKGETLAALITDPLSSAQRKALFVLLQPLSFTVLCQGQNRRPGDVRLREPLVYATTQKTLQTTLHGLFFTVSPPSFFQVNRFLTPALYAKALSFFSDLPDATVLDLYCGTGTTSLLLAQQAKRVIGVEMVEAAVADARQNAERNGLPNVSFIAAKAEEILPPLTTDFAKKRLCVLVDPPRKGLDESVRRALLSTDLRELVYISCYPETLARDLRDFRQQGWTLDSLCVADMFPNTPEIETVVRMRRI
ncbi:methyltransferase domain-containing protein [Murdochiella sp. Marseille-P8839]|nr:methyltransferase domain-containing protein [Murdochiella sp. Marseille-P8839]